MKLYCEKCQKFVKVKTDSKGDHCSECNEIIK